MPKQDVKTGAVYTGNFVLSVLNLKQLELATDEDKKWQIDHWARLFKATTWEELLMTATDSIEMTNVAETLYDNNQDEYARSWTMSREMFLFEVTAETEQLRAKLISHGIDPDA